MSIANCTKCNKVYHRKRSPLCPECYQASLNNASVVYRFLQDHPPLTLEDVAKQCRLPIKDLEFMLSCGTLGTAARNIIFHCQSCTRVISALQRKGHFCPECAGRIETEAGLSEKEGSSSSPASVPEQRDKKSKNPQTEPLEPSTVREDQWTDPIPAEDIHVKNESISPLGGSYGFKRTSD